MNQPTTVRLSRRAMMRMSAASAATLAVAAPSVPSLVAAQSAATPAGGATPTPDRAALFAELDAFIQQRMAELQVPGVALGIVDGDVDHTVGYGVTNLDHPLPIDASTLFQIGSTTKTVTGTAAMRLVEQGRLDLDEPVRTYLPTFHVVDETASAEVRVGNLTNHTAGWFGDDLSETGDNDDALARFVEVNVAALPQLFPVGAYFSYNNAAVDLLGRVIEVVSGQRYEDAIRDLVLAPLGMANSFFFAEDLMTQAFAVGHTASPDDPTGPPVVVTPWAIPRASNPAGGVTSSIEDQIRYLRFHLGDGSVDGQRVLETATLRAMQEPTGPGGNLGPDLLDGVGINWLLSTRAGTRIVSHGGSTYGQQSAFMMVPERSLGVTVLTNSDSGAVLGEEVTDWVLDRFLGLPRVTPPLVSLAADQLADYPGTFDAGGGQQATVAPRDGGLTLTVVGQSFDLDPIGDDHFLGTLAGITMIFDFERDPAGQVGWLRISGRMAPKVG